MIYQFELPFNFKTMKKKILELISFKEWMDWRNEPWYKYIPLVTEDLENKSYNNFTKEGLLLQEYLLVWNLPIIKARISKTIYDGHWPSNRGWHRDEPLKYSVRIFIPVMNVRNSFIESEEFPPQKTRTGYGYTWNTGAMHRIFFKENCKKTERITFVIALKADKIQNAEKWAKDFQKISKLYRKQRISEKKIINNITKIFLNNSGIKNKKE